MTLLFSETQPAFIEMSLIQLLKFAHILAESVFCCRIQIMCVFLSVATRA